MFIGGSPGGTAGGVKTTTIAMLMLTCIAFVRGGQDTECFGRRISAQNVRMGFVTVVLALICYLTGTTLIAVFEADRLSFLNIMYETASALGTVGLTADLTSNLCRESQAVINCTNVYWKSRTCDNCTFVCRKKESKRQDTHTSDE